VAGWKEEVGRGKRFGSSLGHVFGDIYGFAIPIGSVRAAVSMDAGWTTVFFSLD
jgi:type 1 glutamine amidotransferase